MYHICYFTKNNIKHFEYVSYYYIIRNIDMELEELEKTENIEVQNAQVFNYDAETKKFNVYHLGNLLANLSIFCVCALLYSVVSQIIITVFVGLFMFLLIIFWLAVTICTLGLIYAINPNFGNILSTIQNSGEFMEKVQKLFSAILPFWPVGLALSVIAGVASLIILNKICPKQHTAKKVFVIISMVVSVIISIVIVAGVIGGAKWKS